jgi:membrane-associated HD superfamily phosphohydrolase
MPHKKENLLRNTNRSSELILGYVSAIISVAFASLLVWLVYIVGWRNPREYDTHDLLKASTLLIFSVLLVIAVGFSVLAFRLIAGKSKYLMSPMLLRIWGVFFASGSAAVLIDCIVNQKSSEIRDSWETLTLSISMAAAAFVLARKQEQKIEKQTPNDKPAT